jgi:chromosome segregation protein
MPWLQRQGLGELSRLWQQIEVDPGWETALEAVLLERMNALELRTLDHARAFTGDAPPARLAFFQSPAQVAELPAGLTGARRLLEWVHARDVALQTILQVWLRDVYVAGDLTEALSRRAELSDGAAWVVAAGHVVTRHAVRFYAAESEQTGLLARRQQIDNRARELKAAQLIVDEAVDAHARADAEVRSLTAELQPARQRIGELMRAQHEAELLHHRLAQQQAQSD